MRGSVVRAAVVLGCSALAVACGEPSTEPGRTAVAFVGDRPVYLDELEAYFERNLIEEEDPGEDPAQPGGDEVRSRLLDALIEERILLAEAERRGLEVDPPEVERWLDFVGDSDPGADAAVRREHARDELRIQKLQEEALAALPPMSPAAVDRYADEHRASLLPEEPVELRALLLPSREEAERVWNEIRRKRMTFREAVIAHESSPGQAGAQRLAWDRLSPNIQKALEGLEPGQVSRPTETHGGIYLFQVGSWLRNPVEVRAQLRERAMAELETLRRREALDEQLARLRRRWPVRIRSQALPFPYVPAP